MMDEVGIEIPLCRQRPVDPGFAGLVAAVIKHLARVRYECRQCRADLRIVATGTGHHHLPAPHLHGEAGVNAERADAEHVVLRRFGASAAAGSSSGAPTVCGSARSLR